MYNAYMHYSDVYCRESAHKEKKKAEDRLKIAVDVQQQSLQRAMDAEVNNSSFVVLM